MEKRVIYTEKKRYSRFDENHCMVYLNEEIIPDFVPEMEEMEDHADNILPVTGFAYTGTMPDGGTLIATKTENYDGFVSGLIRLKYSTDAEAAIQANMISALTDPGNPRAEEFREEWNSFQAYREHCKEMSRLLLQ